MIRQKQRLYLLRVHERSLPPEMKDYAHPRCRKATNIMLRKEHFQPCIAMGTFTEFDSSLAIWAANTNYLPIYLLNDELCRKFPQAATALFIHALDTAVDRREQDGLLFAEPADGQYLVADLQIKDVDAVMEKSLVDYQRELAEAAEAEERERWEQWEELREEFDEYLEAWAVYQSEDVDEKLVEGWTNERDESSWPDEDAAEDSEARLTEDNHSQPKQTDNDKTKLAAAFAHLRQFAYAVHLHGEPARLSEARERLDRLIQRWQFCPSDFSRRDINRLRWLMQHREFYPRKAHCFKCGRHLYDHLDRTCLQCSKYQIICSAPRCGVCGCKHDPSYARK